MSQAVAELRTDWLTGRTVIVAENRALRPNEFAGTTASAAASVANLALAEVGLLDAAGAPRCPFCPGNESTTPPAVYEQLDERGQWRVRVVPNKYPAVTLAADDGLESFASPTAVEAVAPSLEAALGVHEVIIETARHVEATSALSVRDLRDVLAAYADRLRHWREDGRFAYALVFKNQGPQAGASIAHLHSQFVALARIPHAVEAEMRRAEDDCRQRGSCSYCRLVQQERSCGKRVVLDRDGYVAFCPFASLQPHEIWLLPAEHEASFDEAATPEALDRLAGVLHDLVARLEPIVPHAAYNMILRSSPWTAGGRPWSHWRLELLPRVNALAGWEIATDVHINPIPPERAAAQLRLS